MSARLTIFKKESIQNILLNANLSQHLWNLSACKR